ncbi:hypothetical protein [Serratia ureilytica]|uniref:hypothetical protein n=1 Tax=Serratia ureilytica TaxID=300181 RepID=UPI00313CBFC1
MEINHIPYNSTLYLYTHHHFMSFFDKPLLLIKSMIVFALKHTELGISDLAQKYGDISPLELKHMRLLEENKPLPEEVGCRSDPRQGHAAGRTSKTELTLTRLR